MKVTNIKNVYTCVEILIEGFSSNIEVTRIARSNGEITWHNSLTCNYSKKDSEKLEALYQEYLSGHIKTELTEALSKE
jgi:hypothetical protein